jgi:5-methylcytosine-specific restriction protein A
MPTADEFRAALDKVLAEAQRDRRAHIDVCSGELHREVGGYPGTDHRMPVCCSVMEGALRPGDRIISSPPSGRGASLVIRYKSPRSA